MDFNKWNNDIQKIKTNHDDIFSLNNGKWQVNEKITMLSKYALFFYDSHLDSIKSIALKVLSEVHPQFDLKPEERYAAAIYGKTPKYSTGLRKGISETLAFLGTHGDELKNCSLHKPDTIAILTVRELFKDADWKLWASLNDILPILAETAPHEFIKSIENALQQNPCPFDELFKQEGAGGVMGTNYMTGVYWALETLAWSEEYLAKSILVLAELIIHDTGGNYANRPANSITTILLPWKPQTTASIEKRIASIQGIKRHFSELALNIVINLLPNNHQVSWGSHKPAYRNFLKDLKEEVLESEYWEQVNKYALIAVEMAKGNIDCMTKLVANLDNIPEPAFTQFLEYLSLDEIVKLPDEQKYSIWITMDAFTKKHRRFSTAQWALPLETVDLLEQTTNKLTPKKPEFLYQHLFSNKRHDFFDEGVDWKKQQEIITTQRIDAIKQIYKNNNINTVVNFAKNVDNPEIVGNSFATIANQKNDSELLPTFLEYQEPYKKQFISGYIWSRYFIVGNNWIDTLNADLWSIEQKRVLLFNLPFCNEIWENADKLLTKHIDNYWKKVTVKPYESRGSLVPAIENLLQYDRPFSALDCIYVHKDFNKEFLTEQAITALINGISSTESVTAIDAYHLVEIIKVLQNDSQVSEDVLFKIEWFYRPLLNHSNNANPKIIEKHLSQKPELFLEIIKVMYCSKNEPKDQEIDENRKNTAQNAWYIMHEWKRPPGKLDDGTFSGEALKKWFEEVKTKTKESGHLEIAMNKLGHVLFYANSDPNGLWIHQSVAELLDEKENEAMRDGFTSEIYNSRGAHTVDSTGSAERAIATAWRKKADEIEKLGLINFAMSLKEIANSYDYDAERVISGLKNDIE